MKKNKYIEIHKIEIYPILIYFNDKKIGECHTLLEFDDVRLQIAQQHLDGYIFEFKGIKYPIQSNGSLGCIMDPDFYPNKATNILSNIIKTRSKNINKNEKE